MVDITRKNDFSEKKTRSVASAVVTHDMVSSTAVHELFNLPERCLVTDAYIITEVAGQTNLTVDFGYTGSASAFVNDGDIDNTGVIGANAIALSGNSETINPGLKILTGTGLNVIATFSADPTAGRFVFVVEFIEYTLSNGQLMNYTA